MLKISNLRCEFATNPLGIDTREPRFSWELHHSERGQAQTAHQIWVASTPEKLQAGEADLWNSGKTAASHLPLIDYAGKPLVSRQRAYWQVRAWDTNDRPGDVSEPAWFELALLEPDDWQAEWIGYPAGLNGKALYFRDRFAIEKPVQAARAYVSGLGWYELRLNGEKVGQRVLEPGQTDFSKRVLYSTFDITHHLQPDLNVIGVIVGNGWYGIPKLLLQIEIAFTDGSSTRVVSGKHGLGGHWWQVASGPILENSVYGGEVYDARLELPDWDRPASFHSKLPDQVMWSGAMAIEEPGGQLVPQALEPIEVIQTLLPKSITQPVPGVYVCDVGQNLSGWARLSVQGQAGTRITLRFAEVLHDDGTVNQDNLRTARARDVYILKGEGVEIWEPRFTYHGFRYIQIEGFPGVPDADSVQIRVVRSAVRPVGNFECDHPLINQLHQAVWWTEASNLHSVPTDCPQRDERMGWLNDMAARSEEALYNFDLSRLLPKWLNDVADAQASDGALSDTAPFRWGKRPADPVSVCYLLIPWLLYCHYGDLRVLRDHYGGMKRWVDYLNTRALSGIVEYSYHGDWAPPISESVSGSVGSSAVARNTPGALVSTAYYFYAAQLLAQIANILEQRHDQATYQNLADTISEAFNNRFWNQELGGYGTNNQACNTLALYLGLVPEQRKTQVVNQLVSDIQAQDVHLTTGNLSTKYVLEILTQSGHNALAFSLVTQTTYPSWGYMLANGATTIWERWEQLTGHGMNSHNHPMFGSVGAWIYRVLGGIQAREDAPGFATFDVSPTFPDGMQRATTSLMTIRGLVTADWELKPQGLYLGVRVPVGSRAIVRLPKPPSAWFHVREGQAILRTSRGEYQRVTGISETREESQAVILIVNSGEYRFMVESVTQPDEASRVT